MFLPAIPRIKTQVLHLLFQKLALFAFDTEINFLTNSEKLPEEEDMVLLGVGTQTHVIDVTFRFSPSRNQLSYKRPAPQYTQKFVQ